MPRAVTGELLHDGYRLVYDEFGAGSRVVVLLPGLLLSRQMHRPLAESLAAKGNRVITLDLLGHGESDHPVEPGRYSMTLFAEQVVALLDHLGIDEAVVGGTSLGANVTLETAVLAPERLAGLVIEMPVLDNALSASLLAFTPMVFGLRLVAPLMRLAGAPSRLIPRGSHHLVDTALEYAGQDPAASSAVLRGLFFGRTAPPRAERRRIATPSLVIGHPGDPLHPFSDSDMLVNELPDARLVRAGSILELRLQPERLTGVITRFVDECWSGREARRSPGRRASA